MKRGEIWWADPRPGRGSQPSKRRPVLVVQSDPFNTSRIGTVMVATITSNLRLAEAPGNVKIARRSSKLPKDSVVNVSQVITLDKSMLTSQVASLTQRMMEEIDDGLRLALGL